MVLRKSVGLEGRLGLGMRHGFEKRYGLDEGDLVLRSHVILRAEPWY